MAFEPIALTLETILEKLSRGKQNQQQIVYKALVKGLDNSQRRHIAPSSLHKEVLTLHVDSPTWMYALNLKKAQILKALQEEVGRDTVREIKLKIGKVKDGG